MISCVFFDVDETLVDFDRAATRAHEMLFGDLTGYPYWCELTPVFWPRFTSGELDFVSMRSARMAAYLEHTGLDPDQGVEMEQRRWTAVEESFETYADVLPCLAALRAAGLTLGVITNNDSVHQRRKLATVGLADAFDVVAISGEVGLAKPDPGIFHWACAQAGVRPGAAMHIGDLLDTDALGAASAGLTGVWLDRLSASAGEDRVPVVGSLAEVPSLVESLDRVG